MLGVEVRVTLGREGGKEGVLARREGETVYVFMAYGLAVERYRALVLEQAEDALYERTLARAVFAEEANDLAGAYREAEVPDGLMLAVGLADVFEFYHARIPPKTKLRTLSPAPAGSQASGVM